MKPFWPVKRLQILQLETKPWVEPMRGA